MPLTSILFDTALKPFVPDTTEFRFALPDGVSGKADVKASLSYRWAFKALADSKGWSLDYRPMRETEQAVMF